MNSSLKDGERSSALTDTLNNFTENETVKQIRDLSLRIDRISKHLISGRQKDKDSKRSLSILINRRRRFIRYLRYRYPLLYFDLEKTINLKKIS